MSTHPQYSGSQYPNKALENDFRLLFELTIRFLTQIKVVGEILQTLLSNKELINKDLIARE